MTANFDDRTTWRRVHVGVAALAMVATLPGRTQGLGLFTEPILRTYDLDRETYGVVNTAASLLGAALCLPCGWLLDRVGTRAVLVGVMLLLAAAVVGLGAWAGGLIGLGLFIFLTRGFGQSALSVASLALLGRSVRTPSGPAMGVFSCLVAVGFVVAFGLLMQMDREPPDGWRRTWSGIGYGVLVAATIAGLLVRDARLDVAERRTADSGRTLAEALRTRAFWAFALGTSFYGMVGSGTALFSESILAERGFPTRVFENALVLGIPFGLAANLLAGWLATSRPLGQLCAASLAVLTVSLALFPGIDQEWQAYLYTVGIAVSGGGITVCFFTVWRRQFGLRALGRIQGAAQLLTVVFSALGLALFPAAQARLGSYTPVFVGCAGVSAVLTVLCWFTRIRSSSDGVDA